MTNDTSRRAGGRSLPSNGDGVREALNRIDQPSIVIAQVEQAARTVPAVAALPEEVLRGPFAEAFRRATGHVLRAFVEDRPHTEAELRDTAVAFAEVMAVWGLVIDDVMAAFAQGARVLWEVAARHAAPEQLRELLRAGGGALDSAALVERIARESAAYRERRHGQAERAARSLLASTVDDAGRVPHPRSARVFVAVRPGSDLLGQAALAAELRAAGVTTVTRDDHVSGSLPFGAPDPDLDGDVLVVEALPRPGSLEARRRRLHEVLTIAIERGRRGRLTDLDLAPERLLAAASEVSGHLRDAVAAVASAPFGAPLVVTAEAFVAADGDITSTARALALHRETARHRVRRIEETTGLELGGWRGRCALSLALRTLPDALEDPDAPPAASAGERSTTADSAVIRAILRRLDRAAIEHRLVASRRAHQPALASTLAAVGAEAANAAADVAEVLALLRVEATSRERDLVGPIRRTLEYLRLNATAADVVAIGRSTPRIVWHAVLDAATDDELRHLRSAMGRLILYVEATQMAITHAAEPDRASSGVGLLRVLLDPEATDQSLIGFAAEAGLTVDTPRRGFVIDLGPTATTPARRIAMDLRAAGWAAVARGGRALGFAPADAVEARLVERVPADAVVVLGPPMPVRELGAGIRRLGRLTDAARADGRTGRLDVSASTIELLLIARPDIGHAFREAIVAPLERRDAARGSALAATLRQYVDHDLQRGAAAAAMHLHPNSMDHRLLLIKNEIGRTFSTIDDVFAVLLGVTADRLGAASGSHGERGADDGARAAPGHHG